MATSNWELMQNTKGEKNLLYPIAQMCFRSRVKATDLSSSRPKKRGAPLPKSTRGAKAQKPVILGP
jgi:hypothetical protein